MSHESPASQRSLAFNILQQKSIPHGEPVALRINVEILLRGSSHVSSRPAESAIRVRERRINADGADDAVSILPTAQILASPLVRGQNRKLTAEDKSCRSLATSGDPPVPNNVQRSYDDGSWNRSNQTSW